MKVMSVHYSYPYPLSIPNSERYLLQIDNTYGVSFCNKEEAEKCLKESDVLLYTSGLSPNTVDYEFDFIRGCKKINPKIIIVPFIQSNEWDKNPTIESLIQLCVNLHAQLCVETTVRTTNNLSYKTRIVDVLGNVIVDWTETDAIPTLLNRCRVMVEHFKSRVQTVCMSIDFPQYIDMNDLRVKDLCEKVRGFSKSFDLLVPKPDNALLPNELKERFMGNASFRCVSGFASFRHNEGFVITKRNVDKNGIKEKDFVYVPFITASDYMGYYGDGKPSVDAAIHNDIYQIYPHINYIIHGHVYVNGAPFTSKVIPCGCRCEAKEIEKTRNLFSHIHVCTIPEMAWAINLLGHGFVICSSNIYVIDVFASRFMSKSIVTKFSMLY